MSDVRKDVGIVTAYGYAVEGGYQGTEAQYTELMGSVANIAQEATDAKTAAETAQGKAEDAQEAAERAQGLADDAKTSAGGSASSASESALKAEGFAVGEQNEVEVGSDSPYYHNNAKYYSEEAGDSATQAAASAATSAAMTGLAPQFDSTKAYSAGDYVLYSGTLYQFTSAHAAGAWTGTDAVAVTLAPEVTDLKSQIDASQIVCNASGAIASFADGSDGVPVRDLTVALEPVQDLHGQESPYPAGGGKNKFQTTATTQTINGKTFTVNADGSVSLSGTATASIGSFMVGEVTLPVGTYKVNGVSGGAVNGVRCTVSNMSKTPLEVITTLYGYKDVQFELTEESNIRLTIIVPNGDTTALTIYPMIRLASVTDNTFAPYENICPITGYDSGTVWGTGKNLLPQDLAFIQIMTVTFEDAIFLTTGSYTIAFETTTATSWRYYIVAYNASGTKLLTGTQLTSTEIAWRANQYGWLQVANTTQKYLRFEVVEPAYFAFGLKDGNVTASDTFEHSQLEVGSTASAWSPYTGASYHSDFPSTVYGGDWAVTEGEIASGWAIADLGDLTWTRNATYGFFQSGEFGIKKGASDTLSPVICEQYKTDNVKPLAQISENDFTILQRNTYANVCVNDSRYSDAESFRTAVAGVKICYELATPITLSATPHTIPTHYGDNNVWADCGDSNVDYVADPKLYIEQLTEPDADMIADSNITSGSYFMVGNQLFLATSNIASGGAITPSVNCTRTNLAEALNALNA